MSKKFVVGMMAAVTMLTGLTSIHAGAVMNDNVHSKAIELCDLEAKRGAGYLRCSHSDIEKISKMYDNDFGVIKFESVSLKPNGTLHGVVFIGHVENGFYMYKSYIVGTTEDYTAWTIEDVDDEVNCIEYSKMIESEMYRGCRVYY